MNSETDASKCIDLPGGSLSPGNQLEVWQCNGCWNQDLLIRGPNSQLLTSAENTASVTARPKLRAGGSCPPQPGPSPGPSPGPGPSPPPPSPTPGGGSIMPYCQDGDQYGWPKFQDQNALKADAAWSKYFTSVYGSLPTTGYPICTYGLYFIHYDLFQQAGVQKSLGRGFSNGDLYKINQEFGGAIYMIKHSTGNIKGFDSNRWIEGAHC